MNTFEMPFWSKQQSVIGIDEAGRGPLAGPMVVAGVVFEANYQHSLINDSKKLSEKKRRELFDVIMKDALEIIIMVVDEVTIDQLNIYQAAKKAMTDIARISVADAVLTDAMPLEIDKPVISIIKGDQRSISIAAASIIAKVVRDNKMIHLDKQYPQFGFARHKGYPTAAHLEAIATFGITACHRRSYGPVMFHQQSLFSDKG